MKELNLIRRWWLEWRNRWNSIAGNAILRLGDASGESKLSVRNSDDQEVFYVRSDGRTSVEPGEGADGEALLRGGGRSLLGDLAVAAGKTVDGVDISSFADSVDSWQNTHVQAGSDPHPQYITASTAASTYARGDTSVNGTNGLSGGGALGTGTNTLNLSVNTGYAFAWAAQHSFGEGAKIAQGKSLGFADSFGVVDAEVKRAAANTLTLGDGDQLQSTDFSAGAYGYRIDASGNAEFNNVRVRGELASTVFRFDEVSATAGTLGVYYSASTVHAGFTTPSALNGTVNAQIKNSTPTSTTALFANGDRLQVRVWNGTALVTAWFTVDANPTASTGFSTYALRLQFGSTSAFIPAGTAIVNWGTSSGGGAVALSADSAIGTAPNVSVLTTSGSPWSDQALRARLGNLNGSYGYTQDAFGFAAGDNATTFVAVDSTNGFRAVNNTINRFAVDTSGNVTLRDGGGVARISLTSAGVVQVNDGAGVARVLVDSGGLKLRDNAGNAAITLDAFGDSQFTGVMTIASSGEIRQGTGSLTASPATYTGLRMWRDGNVGRIGGYNNGTLQWYAGTDGRFYGGGGNVRLDSSGIAVIPAPSVDGWSNVSSYLFLSTLTTKFGFYGTSYDLDGLPKNSGRQLAIINDGTAGNHTIDFYSKDVIHINSGINEVRIGSGGSGQGGLSVGYTTTGALNGQIKAVTGMFSGGLNVGSASGAATGEIRASGAISAGTNVGVGVTNPGGPLEVYKGVSGGLGGHIILNNNSAAVGNETALIFNDSGAGNTGSVRAAISSTVEGSPFFGDIKFKTGLSSYASLTTRVIITGQGRVGIGTTTPQYGIDCTAGSVNTSFYFRVNGTQVVTSRRTGWAAPTGTATRATFATGTVTTAQLAERVKALIDDLTTHGLIGA